MQNQKLEEVKEIRVSAKSDVTTLSSYIHTSLNTHNRTCIVAIGPHAINAAIKGIAIARDNLRGTGLDILALPEFTEVVMDNIEVNGKPLTEQGREVVKDALNKAVTAEEADNTSPRVHVAMRIFVEHCHRLVDTVGPVSIADSLTGGTKTIQRTTENIRQDQKVQRKNQRTRDTRNRKQMSEEEIFLRGVKGNGKETLNSNGIRRV